jgi:hypothetical protein
MLKRRLKEPFGKAGLTVAVIALVMALVGGAYAAGGLTKSQEKQVTKIAKKFAGTPGATGPAGPAGTNGTNGTAGKNGTSGKSVVSHEFTGTHAGCSEERGGTEFEVEGTAAKTYACNGKEGSPWTAGGTLPANTSEHGTWTASGLYMEGNEMFVPISFPIPLKQPLAESAVHFIAGPTLPEIIAHEAPKGPVECEEGTYKEPKAAPGNLCIYEKVSGRLAGQGGFASPSENNPEAFFSAGAGKSGSYLIGDASFASPPTEPKNAFAIGTWVVTAE